MVALASGCSAPVRPATREPVSIRLEAVWPHHPILAHTRPSGGRFSAALPREAPRPPSPAPIVLQAPDAGREADRPEADAAAARRRAEFEAQLQRRTERRLAADERANQADLAAEVAAAGAGLRSRRAAEMSAIDNRWRGRLTNVKLLVLSRTQQLTSLAGGPPDEVRAKLAEARELQAAMEAAWLRERTAAAGRYAQALADAREAAQTAEEQRRSALVARLSTQDQRRLARIGRDGRSSRDATAGSEAPAGWPPPMPTPARRAARRPGPPPPDAKPAGTDAALTRFAREDGERWVRRIARESGWELRRPGPGVRDATGEALAKLRTLWR